MPFRVSAKSFIITYPRCDVDKEVILQWFQDHFMLLGCRVARELHADGTPHIHVVFHIANTFQTRNARYFDIGDHHPNVQSTRGLPASYAYVAKDGDYIDFGTIPATRPHGSWADIANATTKEEALALVKETSPRDYVLNYDKIISFCESHFANRTEAYVPIYQNFNGLPQQLTTWCDQRLEVSERHSPPPAAGLPPQPPTEWGELLYIVTNQSLGHHMYFNAMFDLGEWDDGAQYAIFDDWADWSKFYAYKQFLGAQRQFTITDKYRRKRTVRWGKPAIVISNLRPAWEDEDWITVNCFQCHLLGALF
ncbi:replication-associated protein [Sewage-associated circular DNA virus-37]|uniref:replication-associated protein n=1 Tax=Sewage-associated circular DNA virus-37 TaxID=1592104 RepID=UPI000586280B|nr:replication-associated protein [Sewage-associated circular DNA virus-37]AJD07521.1 replication-associated protein [Sewage-associated circular DNA virus-37]